MSKAYDNRQSALGRLYDTYRESVDEIALISLRTIAEAARELNPKAVFFGAAWSDQGPHLWEDGLYDANQSELEIEDPISLEDDDVAILFANLDENCKGAWEPFVKSDAHGDYYKFDIDYILSNLEIDSARDAAQRACHDAGLGVMWPIIEVLLDRETFDSDLLLARLADCDLQEAYEHSIGPGIDALSRYLNAELGLPMLDDREGGEQCNTSP